MPAGAALGADDNHTTAFTAIFIGRHVVDYFLFVFLFSMLLSVFLVPGRPCGGFLDCELASLNVDLGPVRSELCVLLKCRGQYRRLETGEETYRRIIEPGCEYVVVILVLTLA